MSPAGPERVEDSRRSLRELTNGVPQETVRKRGASKREKKRRQRQRSDVEEEEEEDDDNKRS